MKNREFFSQGKQPGGLGRLLAERQCVRMAGKKKNGQKNEDDAAERRGPK